LEVAYGETQPPAERAAKQAAFREGKQELKDFLKLDQLRAANDEMRKGTVQALHELFRTKKEDELRVLLFDPAPGGSRRWEEVRDRVQFTYDANVIFGIGRKPLYRADVSIVVETEPGAAATGETKSWRVVRIEPILVVDPKDHMLKID
jgi:hypothetical protein